MVTTKTEIAFEFPRISLSFESYALIFHPLSKAAALSSKTSGSGRPGSVTF